MTLIIYSGNTTTVKGYLRVAAGGATSTVIQVNEFSVGVVNLADNDRIDAYATYSIWDKLVSATAALLKDSRIAVSDNPTNPPPIANAGGLWYGFNDDGQTYATVSFDASVSINVDPDSGAGKTYLWAVSDGTITVGTTTTSSITATFPVGFRHVQLTVTDSGNSKSTVRQIPVRVYNRNTTRPLMVSNAALDYSHEEGHSARFELPKGSESSVTTLPDGALIVFFTDEYYGDARVSYGSNVSGRSHIKFVGYLVRDTININATNNTVSFEAISPLGILNKTPALPQLMVQNSSGTLWRHVKTLNTNRMLWYLAHWGATADIYFDFVWQLTGSALGYRRVAVTEVSSVGAQLRDIAQSINLKVTCDRLGRILFIQDFDYLSSANRSSRTVVYNFTTADIRELELTNEHRGTVKFVRGEGITDGTTVGANRPVFSNSPGNAPAPFGTGSETLARQIVDDQTDINARTGYHFAKVNGLYDGLFVPQGARLRLPSGYGWIDPAYNEPLTITLAATSNKRARSYTTSTRWTASGASLSFDAELGTIDVSYTIDHETTGQPGTTYIKPQAAANGLPSFPPIDLAMPPPVIPATDTPLTTGTSTVAAFRAGSTTFWTTPDFSTPEAAGGPTWTSVNISGSINGTIVSVIADPWSPLYIGTGTTVDGWLASTTRLYRFTDLFDVGVGRTFTQLLVFFASVSAAGEPLRVLATERAVQNFVMCSSYYGASGGVYIATATDGATFTETQRTAHYNTSAAFPWNGTPGLWVSGKKAGVAYATAFNATGSGLAATTSLYKTSNYGSSWSAVSGFSTGGSLGHCLHMPWHDNVDASNNERYVYYTKNLTSPDIELYRLNMLTGAEISVNPVGGGNTGGSWSNAIAIDSSVIDRLSMAISGLRPSGGLGNTALYVSRDGGLTWTQRTTETVNNRIQGFRFVPNSRDAFYTVGGTANAVGYSGDFGVILDVKTGNITSFSEPVALIGG